MDEKHSRNGGGGSSGNAASRKSDELAAKRSSSSMPGSVPGAAVCFSHRSSSSLNPIERMQFVSPAQRFAAAAVLASSRLLPRVNAVRFFIVYGPVTLVGCSRTLSRWLSRAVGAAPYDGEAGGDAGAPPAAASTGAAGLMSPFTHTRSWRLRENSFATSSAGRSSGSTVG